MFILHAHTVAPVATAPIANGAIAIESDRITALDPYNELKARFPHADTLDLSDNVVIPGLINAHTHLELSALKGRVPYTGDFTEWIAQIITARKKQTDLSKNLANTIANACTQSIATGVTTVADICHNHRAWPFLADQPIRKVCFAEIIGPTSDCSAQLTYIERCITETNTDHLLTLGLSPHAPYSTSPTLYQAAAHHAAQHNLPLTTHLAETLAEHEFLTTDKGPWLAFLRSINQWDNSFNCPHTSPVRYFLNLDLADRPFLLAHVNYPDNTDLTLLAQSNHSIAYCPRSHAFFKHPPHPFERMINMGINVCIGTDSLASNESLSILDELRFLYRRRTTLSPDNLLRMATLNAATALHLNQDIGTLSPNAQADLTAIPLPKPNQTTAADAIAAILTADTTPCLTMIAGRILHNTHPNAQHHDHPWL